MDKRVKNFLITSAVALSILWGITLASGQIIVEDGQVCQGAWTQMEVSAEARGWEHKELPPALRDQITARYNALPPESDTKFDHIWIAVMSDENSQYYGEQVYIFTTDPDCVVNIMNLKDLEPEDDRKDTF